MYVILIGLVVSFYYLNSFIFDQITFSKSFEIIKIFNKNNAISFSFDPKEKYTLWSGLLGGFFSLSLILAQINHKCLGISMQKIRMKVELV